MGPRGFYKAFDIFVYRKLFLYCPAGVAVENILQ